MKFLLFQIATLAFFQVNSVYSAVLTCKSTTPPCEISSITPVSSANEIITISGKASNYVDETTTYLTFNGPNILNYVPTKLFTIFPKLNSISFNNVSLTNVVSNAFANCGNLMTIMISSNDFTTLPTNFASTCINVTTLQLFSNNIKSIDADAFKGLTFLSYLYLINNKIACIPPKLFQNTPVISYIDLSNNQISEIHADTFKNLPSLTNINLMNNSIVNLPAFDLTGTNLAMMSLMFQIYYNPINSISPKFISNIYSNRGGAMSAPSVMLYTTGTNSIINTCIPDNSNSYSIYGSNWPTANLLLAPCYANWKDSYQTSLSCAPNYPTDIGNSFNSSFPFGGKNFFSIITNIVKNFTATVTFY
ncbi:hypothetical protein PVAND_013116 [Polypedilum vanderplanki]|uniref:L domain-like protein n=1 Tax=Polypedilum vanderplanki TaxID=319348 RepID=A0A9J6CQG7_POLVA|nr:hypothetical protein PVAND_013116 [Polypedilum vanderplanki]